MLPIRKICSEIKLSFCFREAETTDSKQIRQENNCLGQMFSVKNWAATVLAATRENGHFLDCFSWRNGTWDSGQMPPCLFILLKLFRSSLRCKRACVWLCVCVCVSNHYEFNYYDSGFRKENWFKKKQWEASIRFCLVAIFTEWTTNPKMFISSHTSFKNWVLVIGSLTSKVFF